MSEMAFIEIDGHRVSVIKGQETACSHCGHEDKPALPQEISGHWEMCCDECATREREIAELDYQGVGASDYWHAEKELATLRAQLTAAQEKNARLEKVARKVLADANFGLDEGDALGRTNTLIHIRDDVATALSNQEEEQS